MKCECDECRGEGTITCPECNGIGVYDGDILEMKLPRSIAYYDELIEIQKDAKRIVRQAARLKELKPHRATSYDAQLEATLKVINAEADRVAEEPLAEPGIRSVFSQPRQFDGSLKIQSQRPSIF